MRTIVAWVVGVLFTMVSCVPGRSIRVISLEKETKLRWRSVSTNVKGGQAKVVGYQVGLVRVDPQEDLQLLEIQTKNVPDTSIAVYVPTPGLYIVRVRAVDANGLWSIWRYSTDTLQTGPPWIGERKN